MAKLRVLGVKLGCRTLISWILVKLLSDNFFVTVNTLCQGWKCFLNSLHRFQHSLFAKLLQLYFVFSEPSIQQSGGGKLLWIKIDAVLRNQIALLGLFLVRFFKAWQTLGQLAFYWSFNVELDQRASNLKIDLFVWLDFQRCLHLD